MLIDGWMPAYDVVERHETMVDAPPARVWTAMRTLDLSRSPLVRVLFALRSLPGLFTRGARQKALGTTLGRPRAGGLGAAALCARRAPGAVPPRRAEEGAGDHDGPAAGERLRAAGGEGGGRGGAGA